MLMNNPWIKGSLEGKILNHTKLKENKNTTYQNVWDSAKALLYGALHAFIRKETSFSKFHLKKLGEKSKPKTGE